MSHPFRIRTGKALDTETAPEFGSAARCPFCKDGENIVLEDEGELFTAHCDGCGAEGPSFQTQQEAADAWNNRAVSYGGEHVSAVKSGCESSEIQALRMRIFQAMNLVYVVSMACSEEDLEDMSRRGTLEAAHKVLDAVALDLCDISGQ